MDIIQTECLRSEDEYFDTSFERLATVIFSC